jgi:anti-sigma factor RsiW
MNHSCQSIVPVLFRVAEGEATPDEAMRTARHLSDCTACRILLARERRLAAMLDDGLDDPLQVGEDFVRAVMDTLPQGPPPRPRRKRRERRALKLASVAGLIGLARLLAAVQGATEIPNGTVWSLIPRLDAPLADGTAEATQRLGGLLLTALDRLAAGLPLLGELPVSGLAAGLAFVPVALLATLVSVSAIALAMRGILRTPSSESA